MKYRIIETKNGDIYPQYKSGLFSSWKFLFADADTSPYMREIFVVTKDPAAAARFRTEQDAIGFIARLREKARKFYAAEEAATRREIFGVEHVKSKRVDL